MMWVLIMLRNCADMHIAILLSVRAWAYTPDITLRYVYGAPVTCTKVGFRWMGWLMRLLHGTVVRLRRLKRKVMVLRSFKNSGLKP